MKFAAVIGLTLIASSPAFAWEGENSTAAARACMAKYKFTYAEWPRLRRARGESQSLSCLPGCVE